MPEPGLQATAELTVTEHDTAVAFGSGDVPVLATPRLIALCEVATVAAVANRLGDGATTVGTRVEIDHLAATPVGGRVTATARLEAVDGNVLHFTVTATDGSRTVARCSVRRSVVDRSRFLSRTEAVT
jgi:predicted thioesterase